MGLPPRAKNNHRDLLVAVVVRYCGLSGLATAGYGLAEAEDEQAE